ncbi:beta-1 adrenergic receptor-like [Actinia tenebrosa]|uniref:Beta-1 adrenergic receptor-like n=1 Tax=Actinia tenebrosa TaxID=6105 RepID=A0A6P8INF7_ACTTE|nr:beta-1 adrenergic receptor-like [Actinia tenebrosa]
MLITMNNSSSSDTNSCLFLHPLLVNTEPIPYVVLTCVLNAVVFLPTVAGNSLILVTMWRNPNLDSPNHIYLFSLATADFITGFVVQPSYVVHKMAWLYSKSSLSCTARIIMEIVAWISAAVSCSTVSIISLDRMLALQLHMRYQLYVTQRRAINSTLSIWIGLTILSCGRFFMKDIRPFVVIGTIGILSGMANVFFAYGQIFRYMKHHRKKIGLQCPSVTGINTSDSETTTAKKVKVKKLWRSAINLAYVVGLFVVAYLPFVSTLIAFLVHGPTMQIDVAYDITRTIVFCVSLVNPFFYCWKISDVKIEVMKTLKKIRKRAIDLDDKRTDGNSQNNGENHTASR